MKKKLGFIIGGLVLILTMTVGGTYAVFQADGETVTTQMSTTSLDISLEGETSQIKFDNIVANQTISKQLSVKNVKDAALYTRVTIKKYWLTENGDKDFETPATDIQLNYNQKEWLKEYADDGEEIVLYYKTPLLNNETTENFLNSITVSKNLGNADQGKTFALDITVDAIQSYNVQEAMLDQWGVLASVDKDNKIIGIQR